MDKYWCSHAHQSFLQQSKFIIFTHLASYTITFVGKSVCSSLIWSDIFSYANICVYLHLFSISFIDVTLLFEWCQYSHLIILCQYFLNYSQTFSPPDEFHITPALELFHLEVTDVLTLKKDLTIAHISCCSTSQKACAFKLQDHSCQGRYSCFNRIIVSEMEQTLPLNFNSQWGRNR